MPLHHLVNERAVERSKDHGVGRGGRERAGGLLGVVLPIADRRLTATAAPFQARPTDGVGLAPSAECTATRAQPSRAEDEPPWRPSRSPGRRSARSTAPTKRRGLTWRRCRKNPEHAGLCGHLAVEQLLGRWSRCTRRFLLTCGFASDGSLGAFRLRTGILLRGARSGLCRKRCGHGTAQHQAGHSVVECGHSTRGWGRGPEHHHQQGENGSPRERMPVNTGSRLAPGRGWIRVLSGTSRLTRVTSPSAVTMWVSSSSSTQNVPAPSGRARPWAMSAASETRSDPSSRKPSHSA